MESTIDRFGRIIIPKKVRDDLDLSPGTQITIEMVNNTIILEPVYGEHNLINKNGVLVFTGKPLENIEEALEKHRKERIKAVGRTFENSV